MVPQNFVKFYFFFIFAYPEIFRTGYFHDKTKIFKENLRVDHYLLLKYCRKQCTLLPPPTWAKSLTKFYPTMQDFDVF